MCHEMKSLKTKLLEIIHSNEYTDNQKLERIAVLVELMNESELTIKPARERLTIEKLFENWDGQPYELTDEDKEWLNMEPVGDEVEI